MALQKPHRLRRRDLPDDDRRPQWVEDRRPVGVRHKRPQNGSAEADHGIDLELFCALRHPSVLFFSRFFFLNGPQVHGLNFEVLNTWDVNQPHMGETDHVGGAAADADRRPLLPSAADV